MKSSKPEIRKNPASQPDRLAFAIPCDFAHVRNASEALSRFLASRHCAAQEATDCNIALIEACNNAIKYTRDPTRTIDLEVHCTDAVIELSVFDHTSGCHWPHRASLPDPDSESGRGIYLIQSVMDDSEYRAGAGRNQLRMRKWRRGVT